MAFTVAPDRERLAQNTDKPPKMTHIAFEGEKKTLCGKIIEKYYTENADGKEDCIVCVDIWKGMHR